MNDTLTLEQILKKAIEHHRKSEWSQAERLYRAVLKMQPKHPDANHNLGLLAMVMNKPDAAVPFFEQALQANPSQLRFYLSYIDGLLQLNQVDRVKQLLAQGRELRLSYNALQPITEPNTEEIKQLLTLFNQGQEAQAENFARDLTQRFPNYGFAWKVLGVILAQQGRLQASLDALQNAIALLPTDAETYKNLGITLKELGRLEEAEVNHRLAIAHKPNYAEAYFNLGITLKALERWDEAENSYRLAIATKPDYAEAYNNLGNILKDRCRLSDAENCYRNAVHIKPDYADAQSNLLFVYNYTAKHSPQFCLAEAKHYAQIVSRNVQRVYRSWSYEVPLEQLRIGFVSGDLHHHVVSYFLLNVLQHLHALSVELVAYPTVAKTDQMTEQLKSYFTEWKPIYALNDEAAARMIHHDNIHILFDLSGHTAHNRLPVFARKPAPIQITWLGYWATTGIAEMDYILADNVGVPENQRWQFVEKVRYLPDTRLCFSTPTAEVTVNELPALTNHYITFGCFQNVSKITDSVLALWSRILAQLPNSRLRFQNAQFSDAKFTELFYLRLAHHTIHSERVSTHGSCIRKDYLAAYNQIDFILDTFPYTGGTTTCEALWMGIPTLTLAGDTLLARQGASLLSAVGLTDWIAEDSTSYEQKALAFAADLDALAKLRCELRDKALASSLFDAPRFAQNFAQLLWDIWQNHQ